MESRQKHPALDLYKGALRDGTAPSPASTPADPTVHLKGWVLMSFSAARWPCARAVGPKYMTLQLPVLALS